MSRVFIYCRVSTADQSNANQVQEVEAAGFTVQPHRVLSETISGSVAARERPAFMNLLNKVEAGDLLVVTKLDRLGRNAMDVRATVEGLAAQGVKVYCLALGGMDLTSTTGKMTMGVIATVAEFERDLLVERTQAGVSRAKASGTHCGRPAKLTGTQLKEVAAKLAGGTSVASLARYYDVSRQTIQRVRPRLSQPAQAQ